MTADDFREIALGMQDAVERAHMGHPDFRANGRIFATLHANGRSGTVKLTAEEQRELGREDPKVFVPAPGAWGRQGWTTIDLERADARTARGAILLAWQNIVNTPPPRRSTTRTARTAKARRKRRT
jgi:hypothetical protein